MSAVKAVDKRHNHQSPNWKTVGGIHNSGSNNSADGPSFGDITFFWRRRRATSVQLIVCGGLAIEDTG